MSEEPKLTWELGTAYDLFASLNVLHKPSEFGLRASWAAGVRSRLPTEARETLEQAQLTIGLPLNWLHNLPDPKDSATALWTLGQIPPAERLPVVAFCSHPSHERDTLFRRIAERGTWDIQDQEAMSNLKGKMLPSRSDMQTALLDVWAQNENFGRRYYEALQTYQDVFFGEEEKRIKPALQEAVSRAQGLAEQMPFVDLIEELSRGVRFASSDWNINEWVMVPSYWFGPLVSYDRLSETRGILLFGGRPFDVSLVPGEAVPDTMLRALKTLADPTRLRILRYLTHENITSAEIARRLRLRAPTVTHHLKALRLAGLVYLTVGEKGERRYASRLDGVTAMMGYLQDFLGEENEAE
jgi:DNA-binding transcriptional ArsR family regulator